MKLKYRILIPILALSVLILGSSYKNDYFEIAKQVEIFTTLFKELNMNYVDDTNPGSLMDSAIKHMLNELDPYTTFLNEQDVEAYKINNTGEYSGIGARVRSTEDKLIIVSPHQGSPADLAGLKAGDEIIKIDDTKVTDFKANATALLKGANNTKVAVTYKRQGATATTTITRGKIEVDAVPFYGMVNASVGYIVLSKFNKKASSQTNDAIVALKDKGATSLILDLRGNPGGLLSEAINVTNLFVPKNELIVTTKSKVQKFNRNYKTKNTPLDTAIPLVVLVDGSSASASEIVSGSLQDLDRAVIVGSRSFGKGLVQRPLKLTYGTQLKVTISRYYTPSGRCIQSLDYWNRDENGDAVRSSTFNSFKTKNGRIVKDGGGVLPDVEIEAQKENSLVAALTANALIFDFATDYYYANSYASVNDFKLKSGTFEAFKTYVQKHPNVFVTATEKALEKAMQYEEKEELGTEVTQDFDTLRKHITAAKIEALNSYEATITKQISDEVLLRYFYKNGVYTYNLTHDEAIKTGTEVLQNPAKMKSILQ